MYFAISSLSFAQFNNFIDMYNVCLYDLNVKQLILIYNIIGGFYLRKIYGSMLG